MEVSMDSPGRPFIPLPDFRVCSACAMPSACKIARHCAKQPRPVTEPALDEREKVGSMLDKWWAGVKR